jgi:hypothetical protein
VKGCLRTYTYPCCGYMVLIQAGRKIEICECMQERLAIHAESKEAEQRSRQSAVPKQGVLL